MPEFLSRPFSTETLSPGQRIALRVEYDGSRYSGWQAQAQLPKVRTVQTEVETALSKIADCPVRVFCAGRTDTGVHATAQWLHFDAPCARSLKAWIVGANAQLPMDVRLADGLSVNEDFHARHSAVARQYDYLIANSRTPSALLANRIVWVRQPIDEVLMHRSLQDLLGECDFSAFRAASCQSTTPMRFMESAQVFRRGEFVQIRVVANAFLHHMVRNIVGSCLQVGLGEQPQSWLKDLLAQRDRTRAAATAPPHGLYLTGVRYPDSLQVRSATDLPFFPSAAQE
ncbi:tRNA pseudouridine(38-40) synthase TruA [Congregibacter variabilis]|uniref:tRNA pseudouridine synthase A n=1 Tax=Congregibacter variabilis TaxID=3081200 RepID=A0ABZ0I752_9GAMM|nr:tRNA pseudouridine(38-40) synthase TruA [Congregibacter sp. IMCC43200]